MCFGLGKSDKQTEPGKKRSTGEVIREIQNEYPLYQGVQPKSKVQSNGNTLLIFEKNEKTEDDLPIKLTLRVTLSPAGKILKVSGSK
jgi:hypothetical protein